MRQLKRGDLEPLRHALHHGTHAALEVVAGERGAHLDLEEDAREVGTAAAGALQRLELAVEVELRLLARGEAGDGLLGLGGVQAQLAHDGAGGGDLELRHPPVGLGEVAHDAEGGAEEALAERREILVREGLGGRSAVLIELVPEQQAECGAEGAQDERADHAAGGFADPFHAGAASGLGAGCEGVTGAAIVASDANAHRLPHPAVAD